MQQAVEECFPMFCISLSIAEFPRLVITRVCLIIYASRYYTYEPEEYMGMIIPLSVNESVEVVSQRATKLLADLEDSLPIWGELYRDLHRNPELSFQEHRTAAIVARHLRDTGYEVTEGVGQTGVVGILHNGAGPVVMLRGDMDALPVKEQTGVDYAS
jgi:hypothetical protein